MGADTVCPVEICFDGHVVGMQKMSLLDNKTIFHLSAVTRAFDGYEKNIKRLVKNTKNRNVQWINLNPKT